MASMICHEASKAAAQYLIDSKDFKAVNGKPPDLEALSTNPKKISVAHARCNGKPGIEGPNSFVCDCICHGMGGLNRVNQSFLQAR